MPIVDIVQGETHWLWTGGKENCDIAAMLGCCLFVQLQVTETFNK